MCTIKSAKTVKNNVVLVISLLLNILFFCIWYGSVNLLTITNYAELLFPWVIVSLFLQMYSFLKLYKVPKIDMGLWFVFLSYLFMFGYVFIDFFGLQSSLLWTPIKEYTQALLFKAVSYVNVSLNMFTLGYLLSYRKNPSIHRRKVEKNTNYDAKTFYIGIFLCIIGGVCQLITSINLVVTTQTADSYSAYSEVSNVGIIDDISFLFVPGIIYVLISRRLNRIKAFILTGVVVGYFSAIMLLSGSRKTQLFGMLVVVLCYLHTYKPPKFKLYKKVILVLGGTVLLNMVYVIRENRMSLSQVIPEFFKSLSSMEFLRNLIPETLAETGITLCSVASIMHCVPQIFPYDYGASVFRSIVSVLPIGWLMPDFFAQASTTTTINEYLNLPVGASMFGDFYWCWGLFGVFFAFLFGKLMSVISVKLQKKSYEVYFSIFYIILMGVRAGLFELVRPLFVVVFVPWFIGYILKRK